VRRRVGVLLDALYDEYASMLVTAFEHEARERDLDLYCFAGGALHSLSGHELARNRCYELVSRRSVDALVVLSLTASSEVAEAFLSRFRDLPKVTVGHAVPGVPVVVADNAAGMREAVVHLISAHGRRRLVFLRGPEDNPEAQTRLQAYRDALRDFGIGYDSGLVLPGDFTTDAARRAMRDLMDRHADFDAVVGANDFSALGALEVLRERDISVPHQVAVIGFDDVLYAKSQAPPLTTVRHPTFEVGYRAVELLLDYLAGRRAEVASVRVPTRLIVRESCGCSGDHAPLGAPERPDRLAEQIAERVAEYRPPEPAYKTGVLGKYSRLVGSASQGALTG